MRFTFNPLLTSAQHCLCHHSHYSMFWVSLGGNVTMLIIIARSNKLYVVFQSNLSGNKSVEGHNTLFVIELFCTIFVKTLKVLLNRLLYFIHTCSTPLYFNMINSLKWEIWAGQIWPVISFNSALDHAKHSKLEANQSGVICNFFSVC